MIIMCIDHARDYTHFHPSDPMNLVDMPFLVYILRILTHFCAPVFILLAGISARISGKRKSKIELTKFLLSRGFILCLLEITLVNWAWSFNPAYKMIYLQVIWAIGISMIVLSLLIHLKDKYILLIAVFIIVGHNLFDEVTFSQNSIMFYIWSFLLQKNVLPITEWLSVRTTYPVLPVIGIITLGYVIGKWYYDALDILRKKVLLTVGLCMLISFFILRLFIGYGDPYSFKIYDNRELTFMSIFNVTKYPLSFQFILMTLSGAFIFLGLTDRKINMPTSPIIIIGQTPLFFYILHIYVIHCIALIGVLCQGITPDFVNNLGGIPSDFGLPLWYLWWIIPLTVLIIYPLSKKYLSLRQSKKYKWTSYI